MTDVIAWPPVGLTGWGITTDYPRSQSVSLQQGMPRESSALRPRRKAIAYVSGIGSDRAGAGYLDVLNDLWGNSSPRLTRVECLSPLFYAAALTNFQNNLIEWTDAGVELLWTHSATGMIWGDGEYPLSGTPTTSGAYNGLIVTGGPANTVIALPSQQITVTDGTTTEAGKVLRPAKTNGSGTATVRTTRDSAFTLDGLVSIGGKESIVFRAEKNPPQVQTLSGDYIFTWNFTEVFEEQYSDGWTEVDPWTA